MLDCGDTFLTGDDSEDLHLWIIVTPPTEGEVVTACMVTAHKKSERLVVLNVGDHPFIKHESVIAYRWSKIRAVDEIEITSVIILRGGWASGPPREMKIGLRIGQARERKRSSSARRS